MNLRKLPQKYGWLKEWVLVITAALVIILGTAWGLRTWYSHSLQPVSHSTQIVYFTVESGENVSQIGKKLKQASLIKSTRAFETYVRSNNLFGFLQAGTYELNQSMSSQEIVSKLTKGEVAKNLLTILPGKRLDEVKEAFIKQGYTVDQIERAFNPANYRDHPALASLPAGASLEGYLYPDSYQKLSDTPAEAIVRQSLDEMSEHLTPEVISGFKAQGISTYEGIILASIVLKEYSNPTDEAEIMPKIAQVFLSRIRQGIALEADPTAIYGAVKDGVQLPSGTGRASTAIAHDSPYNTYQHPGLPPGSISNTNANALKAVANPATSTYLYFLTGDDCVTRFSHTLQEHEEATARYLKNGCQR